MFIPDETRHPQEPKVAQSYSTLVWRRFRRSVSGMFGLCMVTILVVTSLFAEFFAPVDPYLNETSYTPPDVIRFSAPDGSLSLVPYAYPVGDTGEFDPVTLQPVMGVDWSAGSRLRLFAEGYEYRLLGIIPSDTHLLGLANGDSLNLLGTDRLGRDILSRGIIGSQISLIIAVSVVALTTLLGTLIGIAAGYLGGRVDYAVSMVVDFILAFPSLPLYLTLTTLVPVTAPSSTFIAFVIGVMSALGWAQLSKEVRSKTLGLARVDFIKAAVAVGASDRRIVLHHILPNIVSHLIVAITLGIPTVILFESFLGFLGFAVKPPMISWGLMLKDTNNFSVIGSFPWVLSPVGFVLIAVLAFNALGDGLRDSIDPY